MSVSSVNPYSSNFGNNGMTGVRQMAANNEFLLQQIISRQLADMASQQKIPPRPLADIQEAIGNWTA